MFLQKLRHPIPCGPLPKHTIDTECLHFSTRRVIVLAILSVLPRVFSQYCMNSSLTASIPIPLDLHQSVPVRAVFHLAGLGHVVPKVLHIPCGGGAAFGAEPAVEA